MEYMLIRSGRKTLALEINAGGRLVARAPARMPARDIEAFIEMKRAWISQKQAQAKARAAEREALCWRDGAVLPYLGGSITVRVSGAGKPELSGGVLTLPQKGDTRDNGRCWLTERAEELLPARVAHWARVMRVSPSRLLWSRAECRWGSMSREGVMRLNIALMHCPFEAIDYVIVHELAHMLVCDHSPRFHALVRAYLPDADARRAAMRPMSGYTRI